MAARFRRDAVPEQRLDLLGADADPIVDDRDAHALVADRIRSDCEPCVAVGNLVGGLASVVDQLDQNLTKAIDTDARIDAVVAHDLGEDAKDVDNGQSKDILG